MPRPILRLWREFRQESNLRPAVVLLTSAVCLSAWYALGNYRFWFDSLSGNFTSPETIERLAVIGSLVSTVVLLALVPLAVVHFGFRDRVADYGVRLGDIRFAVISSVLATPLVIAIGYVTAQMPAFQAVYPINPPARNSMSALAWHLAGQVLWYASWEFHFRGFIQQTIGKSSGIPTAICVQTLVSVLAHFGKPASELFAAILAGLLWGVLAWRT